jgi:hypothetical protein
LLSAKQIAPGQSGQIEVTIKTEGLAAVDKTVTVTSNDPRQPQIILVLTANLQPEFVFSERSIFFGNVTKDKEVIKEISASVVVDSPAELLSAESTDPSVTVRLTPVAGSNGKQYKLIATLKAGAKEGYHSGTIAIKTSSHYLPEVKIPTNYIITLQK